MNISPITWLYNRLSRHFPTRLINTRLREIDIKILWPACKEQATDLNHAKVAFLSHVLNDPAWRCLEPKEME